MLTQWGRDEMAVIPPTTFSKAFLWMQMCKLRLRFHWNLFPRVQLTLLQHWFRQWLDGGHATSHHLNQWWLRLVTHIPLNKLVISITPEKNDFEVSKNVAAHWTTKVVVPKPLVVNSNTIKLSFLYQSDIHQKEINGNPRERRFMSVQCLYWQIAKTRTISHDRPS